jgi:hypothetical protein
MLRQRWTPPSSDRLWPVRDTRRAELNDRNRGGIAAIRGAKLNGSGVVSSRPPRRRIDARSTHYEAPSTSFVVVKHRVALLFAFDAGRQCVVQSTQHSALATLGSDSLTAAVSQVPQIELSSLPSTLPGHLPEN